MASIENGKSPSSMVLDGPIGRNNVSLFMRATYLLGIAASGLARPGDWKELG